MKMFSFNHLVALSTLRLRVLLRQKIGWMSLSLGAALIVISYVLAQVSFVSPEKIFWDFSLGLSFVLQILLATYLASHTYSEENSRRTLHIVLTRGVKRSDWLLGNGMGLWFCLGVMNAFWLVLTSLFSLVFFGVGISGIILQAQFLVAMELLIVIPLTMTFSLFLRPALAWFLVLALVLLMHSHSAIRSLLEDPTLVQAATNSFYQGVIKALYLLPPLEWFDVRMLVGYEPSLSVLPFLSLLCLAFLWSAFWYFVAYMRFRRMDL
jgi:ABC-type transport system involved in multi-copper enzyme maturation permease subunit